LILCERGGSRSDGYDHTMRGFNIDEDFDEDFDEELPEKITKDEGDEEYFGDDDK